MPRRSALVVGNAHYEDKRFQPLRGPADDAKDLAELLANPAVGNFESVTWLLDATFEEIRRALWAFCTDRTRDDLLLFYYSGHGIKTDRSGKLFLAASDTDFEGFQIKAVDATWVTDLLDESESTKKILILDCCFSGAMDASLTAAGSRAASKAARQLLGTGVDSTVAFGDRGRIIISACNDVQQAWDGRKLHGNPRNSLFTHFLCHGIRTMEADFDGNGTIFHDELYAYLHEKVTAASKELPDVQTPEWAGRVVGRLHIASGQRREQAAAPKTGSNPRVGITLAVTSQAREPIPEFGWTVTIVNEGDDDLKDVRVVTGSWTSPPMLLPVGRAETVELPITTDWQVGVEVNGQSSDGRYVGATARSAGPRLVPPRGSTTPDPADLVGWVNVVARYLEPLSDSELSAKTDEFRRRLEAGETADDLQVEAYAVVGEAAARVVGLERYDSHVVAAGAISRSEIAEIPAGEDNAFIAAMASYLEAVRGRGVHLVTLNDAAAKWTFARLRRLWRFLGLGCGVLLPQLTRDERRRAYAADLTVGTSAQFGNDYLVDQIVKRIEDTVQRGHRFAIVDEADAVLLDRTTSINLATTVADSAKWYQTFARVVPRLRRDDDFEVDKSESTVVVTDRGAAKVEELLGIDDLYAPANFILLDHLNVALKAYELYRRDVDYIVENGEVKIVDAEAGQVLEGSRYSEGLHQAIEAKEGVRIGEDTRTVGSITVANYFGMYERLGGMTATGRTVEREFRKVCGLLVKPVPMDLPRIRVDRPDDVFATRQGKWWVIGDEIRQRHEIGQPIVLATATPDETQTARAFLDDLAIPYVGVEARRPQEHAMAFARAGRRGAVTVLAEVDGRGARILLGGDPEHLAWTEMEARGWDVDGYVEGAMDVDDEDRFDAELVTVLKQIRAVTDAERDEVLGLGGLFVIGAERHLSPRADDQLRQRAGQRAEPGESKFFLSLEDSLLEQYAPHRRLKKLHRWGSEEDEPLPTHQIEKEIDRIQQDYEDGWSSRRMQTFEWDRVLDQQREAVYAWREEFLRGEAPDRLILDWTREVVERHAHDIFDLANEPTSILGRLANVVGIEVDDRDVVDDDSAARLIDELIDLLTNAVREQQERFGIEMAVQVARTVGMSVIDSLWPDHLDDMDALRTAFTAKPTRATVAGYHDRALDLFETMVDELQARLAEYFLRVDIARNVS